MKTVLAICVCLVIGCGQGPAAVEARNDPPESDEVAEVAINLQAHGLPAIADLSKLADALKAVETWKLLLPFIFIGVIVLWQVIERARMEKCPHCKHPVGKPSEWGARKPSDINCPKCGGKLDGESFTTDKNRR